MGYEIALNHRHFESMRLLECMQSMYCTTISDSGIVHLKNATLNCNQVCFGTNLVRGKSLNQFGYNENLFYHFWQLGRRMPKIYSETSEQQQGQAVFRALLTLWDK